MQGNDHLETRCLHFGEEQEHPYGAVVPPIVQTSLFTFPDLDSFFNRALLDPERYYYTRMDNPTLNMVERKVAHLEGAEQALCFSSGMAAISAAILSCLRAGDHVIALRTSYPPVLEFLQDYLQRFRIGVTLVEGVEVAEFEQAMQPHTRLFYLESPSSLVFRLQDLEAVAQLAKRHGILTICDNSWATPIFQNPLSYGIDLVVHSASKYLGGHSDLLGGIVVGSRADWMERVHRERTLLGSILDPFAAWLLLRGLRTLPIRMERHHRNGLQLAAFLAAHPAVARVHHPGLPTHPQHELARRQLRGYSGLFSLELHETEDTRVKRFVNALRLFRIGVSWGGYESLITAFPIERLDEQHSRWLIRLHVGLENAEDLIQDLQQALEQAEMSS